MTPEEQYEYADMASHIKGTARMLLYYERPDHTFIGFGHCKNCMLIALACNSRQRPETYNPHQWCTEVKYE